jgi:parallel beta-helix repeat protein
MPWGKMPTRGPLRPAPAGKPNSLSTAVLRNQYVPAAGRAGRTVRPLCVGAAREDLTPGRDVNVSISGDEAVAAQRRAGRRGTRTMSARAAKVAALVLGATAIGTGGAVANHLPALGLCGDTITVSTTLGADVGPCPQGGLIIGADNITLNLNGHRVFGTPAQTDGAGILLADRTGVIVKNGTVDSFDGGIEIDGGSGNTVMNMLVTDNVGSLATDYGEGIGIFVSSGNVVRNSTVQANGPYAGVGLYAFTVTGSAATTTTGNLISNNTVINNNSVPSTVTSNQDDGIRVEPGVTDNTISANSVSGSGLDGIALFGTASGNIVEGNTVEANGFHNFNHRRGDGIRVFGTADGSLVSRNKICGNAANGLRVDSASNTITNNTVGTGHGCAQNHVAPFTGNFELHDSTALATDNVTTTCNTNSWNGNVTHPAGTLNDAYNNACTIRA